MPRIIIKKKAEVVSEYALSTTQDSYRIGSDLENDIVINDKRVSMHHALLQRHGNHYLIQDLNSAFGTYVNGQIVNKSMEIHDGDLIQVGDHTLVFDNPVENIELPFTSSEINKPTDKDSLSSDGSEVGLDIKETDLATLEALEEELRKESRVFRKPGTDKIESMAPYYLLAIYGPYRGKKYQLKYGDTRIGRDKNLNDIVIDKNNRGQTDQSISRRHATIIFRDDAFYIADKRSKTRTYVNQVMVPEDEEIRLIPGDEIEIVSDQQSTIFRFVPEGDWNFSPPKKAGVWWVRYRSKFIWGFTLVAFLLGVWLMNQGFRSYQVVTRQPKPLTLETVSWPAEEQLNLTGENLIPNLFSADFNRDGYVDVITTDKDSRVVLIDGVSRQIRWTYQAIPVDPSLPMALADLNSNGMKDLILMSKDGRLVTLEGNFGAEIWVSPFFQNPLNAPPVAADFNGDGLTDIAVSDKQGNVHVGYNQQTSLQWSSISTGVPMEAPLTASDLDRDGDFEIICATERGLVLVLDGLTQKVSGSIDINGELNRALGTYLEENQIQYPVGVTDLTGDGIPDFVVTSIQGNLITIDGQSREYLWFDKLAPKPVLKPRHKYPFILTDLQGDGLTDVLVMSASNEIRAYAGSGKDKSPDLIWQYNSHSPFNYPTFVLADFTKDRINDLVLQLSSGIFLILNGKSGLAETSADLAAALPTSLPVIADFKNDGQLDILIRKNTGQLTQLKTNTEVPKASAVWGQTYGSCLNNLTMHDLLPSLSHAYVRLFLGGLFIIIGTITLILYKQQIRIHVRAK